MSTTVRPLNAALQRTAVEQLNEVPERIEADVEALRVWIQQQPHLRARTDTQFLLAFLRGCKFSLEKAKNKIDRFYTLRTKYPEYFNCVDVDEVKIRELIRLGGLFVLPTPLNDEGPRILFARMGTYSVDKYNMEELTRYTQYLQEIQLMDDDYGVIHGIIYLIDASLATTAHLLQMTPSSVKKMSVFAEEALPLRLKQTHFIKVPGGFDKIFNLIRPMLNKKQQSRLTLHGNNLEALYSQIPKKYLPKEYGGDNGSIESCIEDTLRKFDAYRDYFQGNKEFGTDELLRPGNAIDFDDIFGVDGSFRKLEVD